MTPYSCSKLSDVIHDLEEAKADLDFDLKNFHQDPGMAFRSQRRIRGILKSLLFATELGRQEFEKRAELMTIGGRTAMDLKEELVEKGMYIYEDNFYRINKIQTLQSLTEIHTIKLSLTELGFDKLPTMNEFEDQVRRLKLGYCQPEVALYQRLRDVSQPLGKDYSIYMRPMVITLDKDSRFESCYFLDSREDGLWIDTIPSQIWIGRMNSEILFQIWTK